MNQTLLFAHQIYLTHSYVDIQHICVKKELLVFKFWKFLSWTQQWGMLGPISLATSLLHALPASPILPSSIPYSCIQIRFFWVLLLYSMIFIVAKYNIKIMRHLQRRRKEKRKREVNWKFSSSFTSIIRLTSSKS